MRTPKTVQEACSNPQGTYIGGGTDIMPLLKNHVRDDRNLVFLHDIPQLREVREENGALSIGTSATLWDVSQHPLVQSRFPAVAQAAGATASPQIRNIATIGGNILQDRRCIYFNQSRFWRSTLPLCFKTGGSVCHQIPNSPVCRAIYYSDVATALLIYDAEVEYWENETLYRTSVQALIARHIEANGLACGQHLPIFITRFLLPTPPQGEVSGFYKYTMRATIDFPLINFALRCGGNRAAKITVGAVAPEPVVLEKTAVLLSDRSDDEILAACEAELKTLAKPIKEACISPVMKRQLYRQLAFLLPLRDQ